MGRLATDGIAEILAMEEALARLKRKLGESADQTGPHLSAVPDDALSMARFIYVLRRIRDYRFAGTDFGEPAWDILLNLFIARLENKEATIGSAGVAACVPTTTALRWITTLVEDGLVERAADPDNARRVILTLSDKGFERMCDVFAAMRASVEDAPRLAEDLAGKDRRIIAAQLRPRATNDSG